MILLSGVSRKRCHLPRHLSRPLAVEFGFGRVHGRPLRVTHPGNYVLLIVKLNHVLKIIYFICLQIQRSGLRGCCAFWMCKRLHHHEDSCRNANTNCVLPLICSLAVSPPNQLFSCCTRQFPFFRCSPALCGLHDSNPNFFGILSKSY